MCIAQIGRLITTGQASRKVGWLAVNRMRNIFMYVAALTCGLLPTIGAQTASAKSLGSTLNAGETLHPGDWLQSPHGQFLLVMQWDGNLVETQQGMGPIWWTGTDQPINDPGVRADMQKDGNFVVYGKSNAPRWNFGALIGYRYQPESHVTIQDDGNLVVYSSTGQAVWFTKKPYQVTGTGGTLQVRSAASLSAGKVNELRDGTWIDIACQTTGDPVVHSNVWDRIDYPYVGYVADWYTTTPAVGGFSQGLPRCSTAPTGPPPYKCVVASTHRYETGTFWEQLSGEVCYNGQTIGANNRRAQIERKLPIINASNDAVWVETEPQKAVVTFRANNYISTPPSGIESEFKPALEEWRAVRLTVNAKGESSECTAFRRHYNSILLPHTDEGTEPNGCKL